MYARKKPGVSMHTFVSLKSVPFLLLIVLFWDMPPPREKLNKNVQKLTGSRRR